LNKSPFKTAEKLFFLMFSLTSISPLLEIRQILFSHLSLVLTALCYLLTFL